MLSESLWCHAIEAGVGPDGVVVGAPVLDDSPPVDDVTEQVLIEAFVTEPAVETLDEPVASKITCTARCLPIQRRSVLRPFVLLEVLIRSPDGY